MSTRGPSHTPAREGREGVRIEVTGTVQGVGFRPFVHRTATALGLDGWVRNLDGHVQLAAAGRPEAVGALLDRLRSQAPPLARVTAVRAARLRGQQLPPPGSGFTVRASTDAASTTTAAPGIPPDAAICSACLRELFDPGDRRYRYPFINCTDCGPRATVIEALPYDRERTTMRGFPLCRPCAAEYRDPLDRRFHAEPLACTRCGPRLAWGGLSAEDALQAAVGAIAEGGIVAVKGLGGYQLVCDATSPSTVAALRDRKRRPAKPFAVMVRDLHAVRGLAQLSATEEALLTGSARPIVLLAAHRRARLGGVHPGTDLLGLFLPTTGLHHLLLRALDRPLVVTSGNAAGAPIALDDHAARRELSAIADGFLTHDRPIRSRYDDSVVRVAGRTTVTLRRSRGHAPAPLALPVAAPVPLVAAGAQSKHTFTLAEGGQGYLAAHGGDLENCAALDAFEESYAHLRRLTGIEPQAVAHDLHPDYLSTQWARSLPGMRRVAVQHHHAHIASCAAQFGVRSPVTGVAYDGLGLGDDGTLWGGEVLVADLTSYRRVARFATAPLPGGAAALRRPARTVLGYLYGAEAEEKAAADELHDLAPHFTARLDPREHRTVRTMIERGLNCPRASSAGRLFDAAASLLGLIEEVSYEGQAAVALEAAAGRVRAPALPWHIRQTGELRVYEPSVTLAALLRAHARGAPVSALAAAFHTTLAEVTAALVAGAVAQGAPRTVCLSGGCFANRRLLTQTSRLLRARELRVLAGGTVPAGDGGLSYGQAAIAAARLAKG